MHCSLPVVFALGLTVSLTAQSVFTVPPGLENKSGNFYAQNKAIELTTPYYSGVRYQVTHPDMPTGKSTLTRLEWRTHTQFSYTTSRGQGRKINALKLQLGYAAQDIIGTMSLNWKGSPKTVFTGNWSLPAHTAGIPKQVWGNAGRLNLTTPMMFDSASGEMLQEWSHSGGSLANGKTYSAWYYIDGNRSSTQQLVTPSTTSKTNRYLPRHYYSVTSPCVDARSRYTNRDAYATIAFNIYADNHPTVSLRGHMRLQRANAFYTALGAPIIGALTLGGSDTGTNVGAACNKLHVNMAFPLAVIATKTGTSTSTESSQFAGPGRLSTGALIKWRPAHVGQVLYWQAAWGDSASGRFKLTNAVRLTVPGKPAGFKAARYASDFYFGSPPQRSGPTTGQLDRHNPVTRWTRK